MSQQDINMTTINNDIINQDYDEKDFEQLNNKENKTKSDYIEMIQVLDFLKKENIIETKLDLEKIERKFIQTKELDEEISRVQKSFPALKKQSQQSFFDNAVKNDLNDLNNLLTEYRPLLSDDTTKSYFDGIELVEVSFVKSIKNLGINYETPAEIKAKQEEKEREEAAEKARLEAQERTRIELEKAKAEQEKSAEAQANVSTEQQEASTEQVNNQESSSEKQDPVTVDVEPTKTQTQSAETSSEAEVTVEVEENTAQQTEETQQTEADVKTTSKDNNDVSPTTEQTIENQKRENVNLPKDKVMRQSKKSSNK